MNTDTFISKLDNEGGLAPVNRFWCKITGPQGSGAPSVPPNASFLCDSAVLAGRSMMTSNLKHYGTMYKIARESQFAELAVTFILTKNMKERRFFMDWLEYINQANTTNDIRYFDDYKGQIKLGMFPLDQNANDEMSGAFYTQVYEDVYPTFVGAVSLNWGTTNEVGKLDVTMAYRRHKQI